MAAESIVPGLPEPQGIGEEPLKFFTRVYLLFLQGLFKQFPEGSYRWSEDPNFSEIAITDQVPIPRDHIEKRPAILAMRGPTQFANLALDQVSGIDPHTGLKERRDLVACTMSLSCISRVGLEAQRIAWIIMSLVREFKTLIQRCGIHKVGDDVSMGPETPPGQLVTPEADPETVMVTVQSPFFFMWHTKQLPLDAPRLREIEAHMTAVLQTKDPVFKGPSINGRRLDDPGLGMTLKAI
jgi:hypothetical protein